MMLRVLDRRGIVHAAQRVMLNDEVQAESVCGVLFDEPHCCDLARRLTCRRCARLMRSGAHRQLVLFQNMGFASHD